jgi:hypothetical protein
MIWKAVVMRIVGIGVAMKRSRGLVLNLLVLAAAPMACAHSAESQTAQSVRIDATGTVHVPAFDVPLSSYMSDQAKQAFIKAGAAAQSSDTDWKSLSISKIRADWDSELQKYVDRARSLYPVNVEERKMAGVSG